MFATLYALATDLSSNRPAAEETALTVGTVAHAETATINGINYHFDDGSGGLPAADATNVIVAINVSSSVTATNFGAAITANDATLNVDVNADVVTVTAKTQGEGELIVSAMPTSISATTVSIPLYDHLDQIDTALNRILDVRAQIGGRLNVLDSQDNVNQDFKLSIESTKSQIEDIDMAEAISRFNLQIVSLQAAQQAFVKVQGLSLFNHL